MLLTGEYTSMCDVWSYGVLMWEVFSHGDLPYNGQTNNQAREKIETGQSIYVFFSLCSLPYPSKSNPVMF